MFRKSELRTPDKIEEAIRQYSRRGLLAHYDLPSYKDGDTRIDLLYLQECLTYANTQYDAHLKGLVVNPSTLDPDMINLVFIADDPEGAFQDFHNNCAYTGYKNTIICDLNFIKQLAGIPRDIPKQDGSKGAEFELTDYTLRAMVALWVIGHEIGHLAHRHTSHHCLFEGEQNGHLIQNPDGKEDRPDYIFEKEADDFAFEVLARIEGKGGAIGMFLWLGMTGCVHYHIREWLKEHHQPVSDDPIAYENINYVVSPTSRTHPPMLVRATQLAMRLAEDLDRDNTGHFRRIYEDIKVQ